MEPVPAQQALVDMDKQIWIFDLRREDSHLLFRIPKKEGIKINKVEKGWNEKKVVPRLPILVTFKNPLVEQIQKGKYQIHR